MRREPRFFERFRSELHRYAPFVHLVGEPASAPAIAAAAAALGEELPAAYRDFLLSWNGASLFHDALRLHGVGGAGGEGGDVVSATLAGRSAGWALPDEIVVCDLAGAEHALLAPDRPAVVRVEEGSDERLIVASGLEPFLAALMAREGLLYDREGEFRPDVLEEDGEEPVPLIALRAEERAIRVDPTSAFPRYEAARALRRLGRPLEAVARLREAIALEPTFIWAFFDLGRLLLDLARPAEAEPVFLDAAHATSPAADRATFLAWACLAALASADRDRASAHRHAALAADPEIGRRQREAAEAALAAGDEESAGALIRLAVALLPADLAALELSRRLTRAFV